MLKTKEKILDKFATLSSEEILMYISDFAHYSLLKKGEMLDYVDVLSVIEAILLSNDVSTDFLDDFLYRAELISIVRNVLEHDDYEMFIKWDSRLNTEAEIIMSSYMKLYTSIIADRDSFGKLPDYAKKNLYKEIVLSFCYQVRNHLDDFIFAHREDYCGRPCDEENIKFNHEVLCGLFFPDLVTHVFKSDIHEYYAYNNLLFEVTK